MSGEHWSAYVRKVANYGRPGGDDQNEIARKAQTTQETVSRWIKGQRVPRPPYVVMFCQGYDRNPIEGFVAAGYLNAADLRPPALNRSERTLLTELEQDTAGAVAREVAETRKRPPKPAQDERTSQTARRTMN